MVDHGTVAVTTTAASLLAGVQDTRGFDDVARSVLVQNLGSASIFIGGPDVSASDYGYELVAGAEVSLDLELGDVPYAVTAAGTVTVHVLHLGV